MKKTENILKIVAGTLKGNEKKEAFSQLEHNPQAKAEFKKIKNIWALAATRKKMPAHQIESFYFNFKKQLDRKQQTRRLTFSAYLKYAAVFLFAIGISTLFFFLQHDYPNDLQAKTYTTVEAGNGQLSKILLPDSSVVWLNSGTKLRYNNGFAIDNREITLTGQAFFQVTKNERIPLKVFSNDIEVNVLGTKFDFCAYPEDNNVTVFLESGKVEIQKSGSKALYVLSNPGEFAQYNKPTGNLYQHHADPEKFTSWKNGVLIFRDDPMSEVIPRLQRRYDIEIEVATPAVYNAVFTATIKNETLEEIFKSISFACSVRYEIIRGSNLNEKTKIILTDNQTN